MVNKDSDIFLKSVKNVIGGDVNLPCISWLTKIVINIFLQYSNLKLFNGDVNLPCMVSRQCNFPQVCEPSPNW